MNEEKIRELLMPEKTELHIAGLTRPVKLMQITDSHLCHADERESARAQEYAQERTRAFSCCPGFAPEDIFERHLRYGKDNGVDLFVLTGDIIDFPARKNLEELDRMLNRADIPPYLFVAGNHDWMGYKDMPDGRTGLSSVMDPAGVEKRDIGGVALLGIDNTQYQVNERQLEVLRKILSEQTPCILFMHIPLYLPTLEKAVMDFWKSPIVMGIPEHLCAERQPDIIHSPRPTAVTREFWRLCNETPNLRAVFGGHLHFSHEDAMLSGNPQYVTSPGYGGGCRLIDLIPAES